MCEYIKEDSFTNGLVTQASRDPNALPTAQLRQAESLTPKTSLPRPGRLAWTEMLVR